MTGVETGGVVVATYAYNALNQRIGIDDSGGGQTWTVYNGTDPDALPYADFNGSGTLLTRYVSGPGMVNGAVVDELLARTSSGGTTAWYLTDKLDSVRDIVSSSGSVLDHIVYDSFGNILTETNASNGDRFKFAGMDYDSDTSSYYDDARTYEQTIGRFTSMDPLGFRAGDSNLLRYTKNSPSNSTDTSGLSESVQEPSQTAIGAANGAAVAAAQQEMQRQALKVELQEVQKQLQKEYENSIEQSKAASESGYLQLANGLASQAAAIGVARLQAEIMQKDITIYLNNGKRQMLQAKLSAIEMLKAAQAEVKKYVKANCANSEDLLYYSIGMHSWLAVQQAKLKAIAAKAASTDLGVGEKPPDQPPDQLDEWLFPN